MFGNLLGQAKAAAEAAKTTATEYSNQALQSAAIYLPSSENCTGCGCTVSAARSVTGIGALLVCICCGEKYCKKCIRKSVEPVPDHLWSPTVLKTADYMGLVCTHRCLPECVNFWMSAMTLKYEAISIDVVRRQLQEELKNVILFPKPTIILDSKTRKAKRLLYLAEYAAEVIGVDHYLKVIKVAALGSGALSILLQGETAKLLYPLMECLKQFGIEGYSAAQYFLFI